MLLLMIGSLSVAAASEGQIPLSQTYPYTLEGDVQVPLTDRKGQVQGSSFATTASLWPGGKVQYFIETAATNAANPASYMLEADDTRILNGVAHWETKTCIRFTRCATKAACTKPYMYFISDGSGCNSPVGMTTTPGEVNQINLAKDCSAGALIHEMGHSLGLMHEQTRNDRDNYVFVDFAQIKAGKAGQFTKTGGAGRDIGPYDYSSIMHYGAGAFAVGSKPVIVAPAPIGQRLGLSDGDVDTIHFMYNECKAYTTPSCRASRNAGKKITVPHSQAWAVEFNGLYESGKGLTVSYTGTSAPTARISNTVATGTSIGHVGFTKTTFTPDTSDAGKDFTMSATFTAVDGKAVTCSVEVTVANTDAVCFGLPADDPKVCSSRGTCMNNPKSPCQCNTGYGGLECLGFANCPQNFLQPFDEDVGTWTSLGTVTLDVSKYAEGSASWRVGDANDLNAVAQGKLNLVTYTKPRRVTFYIARFADPATPSISFRDGNTQCFMVRFGSGAWNLGFDAATAEAEAKKFYHFDLHIDWSSNKVDLYIDGHQEVKGSFENSCSSGMNEVVMFGAGWLDEFHLWCTSYILMTGSMVEGLTQDQLRAGGTMMTLTLVGDYDEWVDTTATKQAVIDSMQADYPSTTGWNGLRASMIDTSLVAINGQVLTIGPLKATPTFLTATTELVDLYLKGSMFKSGANPQWTHKDVEFQIPGECHHSVNLPFDDPATVSSSITEVTTAVKKEGAGSLTFKKLGFIYTLSAGGIRATSLAFYAQIKAANAQLSVSLKPSGGGSERIRVYVGVGSSFGVKINTGSTEYFGTVSFNTWHKVEVLLNWDTKAITASVDGVVASTLSPLIPAGFETVGLIQFSTSSSGTGGYVDSVALSCKHRDPLFSVAPSCPKPGKDASVFHFYPGTDKLSAADKVAIVPNTVTDCSNAGVECAALNGCSTSLGSMAQVGVATEWSPGTLSGLQGSTEYKVCYYPESYKKWVLIDGSFRTCAATTTSAPATPAPVTPAPATPSPVTPAPSTPAPKTASPATPAPATSAPATSAPSTASPATQAPGTSPPDTLVPDTSAPDTSAPSTSAPKTSAPATSVPATSAPKTTAPATPAPDTASPSTSAPATSAPATSAPKTSVPVTQTPATVSPGKTGAPDTPSPDTKTPATGAPSTSAPKTTAPATPAPNTASPTTQAPATTAPDTSAPATSTPATLAPKTTAPATQTPATLAPGKTGAPNTPAPDTVVPATGAPTTTAPATTAPDTSAPATSIPATSAPATTAPDSSAPATLAPKTTAPATQTPATLAPGKTGAPNTPAPDTKAPTGAPSTSTPKTTAPATPAPDTASPTTQAPATTAPDTSVPATSAPATQTPATLAPGKTGAPNTPAPNTAVPTKAPATDAPATGAPGTQAPSTQSPVTLVPGKTGSPDTPAPDTNSPTTAAPVTSAPATLTPTTLAPGKTAAPETSAPSTEAPATLTPGTTRAPDTSAPSTLKTGAPNTPAPNTAVPTKAPAPGTQAPSTQSPVTLVPGKTGSPDTNSPTTAAPVTSAPATLTPTTLAPGKTAAPETSTEAPATLTPGTTRAPSTLTPAKTGSPGTLTPPTESPATFVPGGTKAPVSVPGLGEDVPAVVPEEDGSGFPWYVVGIVGAVLALCGAAAAAVVVRKRSQGVVTLEDFCQLQEQAPSREAFGQQEHYHV